MVTLCQVVLALNAIGFLAFCWLLFAFRKPIGVAIAMAQNMTQPKTRPVPSTTPLEEALPPEAAEEEALPPEAEGPPPRYEAFSGLPPPLPPRPRKRLTFAPESGE